MIVHVTQIHPRDAWCAAFHVRAYLSFCDRVVIAVDAPTDEFCGAMRSIDSRVAVVEFRGVGGGNEVIDERGVIYQEPAIRQLSLDFAMLFNPSLIVFGDADELPTPDVGAWLKGIVGRPAAEERWYVHWVNLWGDFAHAIGGDSLWSFQSPRGNKKCLAMQPGKDLVYVGDRHTGMEPGRADGGPAPVGPGRHPIDSPKLIHLKYGWSGYADRPEAKLARHDPAVMLRGGEVIDVPTDWLWPGLKELAAA